MPTRSVADPWATRSVQVAHVTSLLNFFVDYGLKTIFKKVPANSAVPIP
jgi:hypothetical protein